MGDNSPKFDDLAEDFLEVGEPVTAVAEHLTHWRCHMDDNDVQWWCLDKADTSTNVLSTAVLEELSELIEQIDNPDNGSRKVRGIVIRSLKRNGFIAGADISEFRDKTDPGEIEEIVARGREVLFALERLNVPSIAVLHGFCLGGGLELALACQYRLARPDSKLGFPEVNLGLHPGLSGTVRLTRQIAPHEAMKMMLTGMPQSAHKCHKLGLVDVVCEERHVAKAVAGAVAGKITERGDTNRARILNLKPAARLIARQSEKQTREKVKPEHYPAPFALIDLYRDFGSDAEQMHIEEGKSFARLLSGPTSQQLIRVFFLQDSLKSSQESQVQTVHVVGAGTMGGDIAAWCALKGLRVTLEDTAAKAIAPALQRAHALFGKKCRDAAEQRRASDRLIPDLGGHGRRRADLIIEAVPEELALKSRILAELEEAKKPDALLATNTSSLLLQDLRGSLQDGAGLVGIHFFNPVAKMPLVEVITHDQQSESASQRAKAFVSRIGRLPVEVKSAPGFLVNRVLTPYLLEAMALLDEGYSREAIDHAAEEFGLPMGPIELADLIGLDICLHVAETLHEQLEQPLYPLPARFKALVQSGRLGKKSGNGFYRYDNNNQPEKDSPASLTQSDIAFLQDRLVLPLLNTCVHCLDEGLVADKDQVDAALIFAMGFPPFTGGPLQYACDRGIGAIQEKLKAFSETHDDGRFQPARGWGAIAEHPKKSQAT